MKRGAGTCRWMAGALVLLMGVLTLVAEAAEKKIDDRAITDAVEDELFVDRAVPANRLDIKTDEGIVTLTGTVRNLLAKERAARIAETVKGVRSVINRVAVHTPPRGDRVITRDVRLALLTDPATDSYELKVETEDGLVTLEGIVESWQEKQLCARVAKGVRGVTGLKNNIEVQYEAERPDPELRAEIEKALRWDVLVDHALIDVKVDNGRVHLNGTVGSAAEKTRAIADSWVAGVKSVDAAELEVRRWARDKDLRKDKYVIKSDQEVRQAIEAAMTRDPRVERANVTPEVVGGLVTLRGNVETLRAKRAARQIARYTVGVVRVKNRLRVRPKEEVMPLELVGTARRVLARDPYVKGAEIVVTAEEGKVTLEGRVDSYFEKIRADEVVSALPGVESVDNNLEVEEDEPYAYSPYVDDYAPYDYDWFGFEPTPTFKSDAEIQADIQNQLYWSPFVDSHDVRVRVEDGVARLSGVVDSFGEFEAATENAYEGGAVWVDNDLQIK